MDSEGQSLEKVSLSEVFAHETKKKFFLTGSALTKMSGVGCEWRQQTETLRPC